MITGVIRCLVFLSVFMWTGWTNNLPGDTETVDMPTMPTLFCTDGILSLSTPRGIFLHFNVPV